MLLAIRASLICVMLLPATILVAETRDEAQCKDVNNGQLVDQTIAACARILSDARERPITR